MEAVAKLKNVPTSPRKMRLVADLIRGEKVSKALNILKYNSRVGAPKLEKLLLSAIANWQDRNEDASLEDADLYIKEVRVDGGRMLKRLRPAPQGRAHRIRKRSNHVTMVIDSLMDVDTALLEQEMAQEAVEKPEKTEKSDKKEKKAKATSKASEKPKAKAKSTAKAKKSDAKPKDEGDEAPAKKKTKSTKK